MKQAAAVFPELEPWAATSTRDRLILAACALFQTSGYAATGVSDILALTHLPKGSLYHHFPGGKEQLAIAVVSQISDDLDQVTAARLAKGGRAGAVLLEIARDCAEFLAASDYGQTPLLGMFGQAEAGSALGEAVDAARSRFVDRIEAAVGGGPGSKDKAWLALSVLEGGLATARLRRATEPLIRASTLAAMQINSRD